MDKVKLYQANTVTQARYDYSLIEKRTIYLIIREVRKRYVLNDDGQRDLFGNLVLTFNRSQLENASFSDADDMYRSLKRLRKRNFDIKGEDGKWLDVGFINYAEHIPRTGKVEIEVSRKILPYLVELSKEYTEYNLTVALSLGSEYSQRLYEYCSQFKAAGGFQMTVSDFREKLMLKEKYKQYGAFKVFVLEAARKELKKLYDKKQCDLYFNYSEEKEGRKIVALKFKIIVSEKENPLSLDDIAYFVRTELSSLFDIKNKPKNKSFIDTVMMALLREPEKLKHCYQKLGFVRSNIPKEEQTKYMRFVINEEYLTGKK